LRILVVEDDVRLSRTLVAALAEHGHAVDTFACGDVADAALRAERFDLVILDLALPELDGLSVLRRMRARGDDAAVLVLTARTSLDDRVTGLDLGADDYMGKPFELPEFEARVRAVLRRRAGIHRSRFAAGNLIFDMAARTVEIDGARVDIPRRELDILEALICRTGRVVSKSDLVAAIARFDDELSPKAVELYVSRLRKRLRDAPVSIRCLRGIGYIFEED